MLGYRTLFTADQAVVGRDLMDEGRAQIHSWLRSPPRNFDTDQMGDGITEFSDGSRCMLVRREGQDGSDTLRFRLTEPKNNGSWTTRLTIRSDTSDRPWVLVEVEDPSTRDEGFGRRQRVDPPGLARHLLDSIDAEDGPVILRARPTRFVGDRLGEVLDWVESHERRGLLVLGAQSDRGMDPEFDQAMEHTAKATAGQASVLILPPEIVNEWNEVVTEQKLPWGGFRVFYPGTLLDEPAHARRNLFITRDRLHQRGPRSVSARVGWMARENAIRTPLPSAVRRVERVMDSVENDMVMSTWKAKERQRREQIRHQPQPARQEPASRTHQVQPADSTAAVLPWPPHELQEAERLVRQAVGEDWTLSQSIEYLLLLAHDSAEQMDQHKATIIHLQDQLAGLKEEIAFVELEREDARDESAKAESRLLSAEDRIRYLEQELVKHSQFDAAFGVVPDEFVTVVPDDFEAILEFLPTLDFVRFIGDPSSALELNELSGVNNALQKTYTAVLALNDYGRAKANGDFAGGLSTYLKHTPLGYRGWYANRHAEFESADVGNQDRYRRPRTFRVDDLDRDIYMEAHLKITQEDTRSPRLHYYDATAETGYVYIGYLGPHLPSKRTN